MYIHASSLMVNIYIYMYIDVGYLSSMNISFNLNYLSSTSKRLYLTEYKLMAVYSQTLKFSAFYDQEE